MCVYVCIYFSSFLRNIYVSNSGYLTLKNRMLEPKYIFISEIITEFHIITHKNKIKIRKITQMLYYFSYEYKFLQTIKKAFIIITTNTEVL